MNLKLYIYIITLYKHIMSRDKDPAYSNGKIKTSD